jgi:hypothetical protein
MMTAGDIEFEPTDEPLPLPTKIHGVTNSIAIMTAGDAGLQTEIIQILRAFTHDRIQKDPSTWILVKEVVDMYVHVYTALRRGRAQSAVLAPLGLDENSFIAKQKDMSKDFIEKIAKELLQFDMPSIATIITGIDTIGPHIYSINNDYGPCRISCLDTIGFAAVGIGARHAESQFMLAGHNPYCFLPETLLLTYSAKKRSEVAPGVGKATDMFTIGPLLGSFAMLSGPTGILNMKELDAIDKRIERRISSTINSSKKEVNKYVEKIIKKRAAEAQQQSNTPTDGTTPPIDGNPSGDDAKDKKK